jgi:nitroreductase
LAASGNNRQPLKYMLSAEPGRNAMIFARLRWAASLKTWAGPQLGERPAAYIIVLGDKEVSQTFGCDHGIASQTIMLAASSMGLGGCMLGAVDRDGLRADLSIAERYEILLVLAIGKPAETIVVDDAAPGSDVSYWRDANDVHHVPKRTIAELIIG